MTSSVSRSIRSARRMSLAERSVAFAGPISEVACPGPAQHAVARRRGGRPPRSRSTAIPSRPRPRSGSSTLRRGATRLGPADRRRPEPSDRHVQTRDVDSAPARHGAGQRRARDLDAAPTAGRGAPRAGRTADDVDRDAPRRPARPARQRRPPPLSRRPTRPTSRTGTSCGASTTPARHLQGTPTGARRRRHRRAPGARHHDRRSGDRSSRSSTTASTSAIRTSPRGPGRTRASRAAARRPTASTTTATATSTTSTAGTSATTTTPSTTSTTTATAPTSPARSRRRSTATGVVGVAPGVSIMALKFISNDDRDCGLDSAGHRRRSTTPKSFGVQIVNASWGGRGRPQDALELYNAIANSGMLFVAAAGNDGDNIDTDPLAEPARRLRPAEHPVGRGDRQHGGLASFSNYGATTVDIAAPGDGDPRAPCRPTPSTPIRAGAGSDGTSMAAPHVSGTAALVASCLPVAGRRSGSRSRPPAGDRQARRGDDRQDRHRPAGRCVPVARHGRADRRCAPSGFAFDVGSTMGGTQIATRVAWPAATDDRQWRRRATALQAQAGGRVVVDGRRHRPRRGARRERSRSARTTASASAPVTAPATGERSWPGRPITAVALPGARVSGRPTAASWRSLRDARRPRAATAATRRARAPSSTFTVHRPGDRGRRAEGPDPRQRQDLRRRRRTSRRSTCTDRRSRRGSSSRHGRGRRSGAHTRRSWSWSGPRGHPRVDVDAFVVLR